MAEPNATGAGRVGSPRGAHEDAGPDELAWALALVVDAAGLAVYHVDLVDAAEWGSGFLRLVGAPDASHLTHEWWRQRIHPTDRAEYVALREQDLAAADGHEVVRNYRVWHDAGVWIDLEEHRRVVGEDGTRRALVGSVRNVTQARRALRDAQLLGRMSELLGTVPAGVATPDALLATLAHAVVPEFADRCAFHLVDGDVLARAAIVPSDEHESDELGATARLRMPIDDAESPIGQAATGRAPVMLAGETPLLCAPLMVRDDLLGVVSFRRVGDSPLPFTADDVPVAIEFARRSAGMLAEVRLRDRAQRDEARLELLYEAITEIAAAPSVADVLHAVEHRGVAAVRASLGAVMLLRPEGSFELVATAGVSDAAVDRWRRFPADMPSPVADAVASQQPVIIVDRDSAIERFPEFAREWTRGTACAWVVVPFPPSVSMQGALWFGFDEPQPFDDGQLRVLDTLVASASQSLARAVVFDAEQRSREMADGLAELTAALAAADDADAVSEAVVRFGASAAGAAYSVLSLGRAGNLRRFQFRDASERTRSTWAAIFRTERTALDEAISRSAPVLLPSVTEASPEFPAVARAALASGIHAIAAFPLEDARGVTVGGLGLAWGHEQRFGDDQRRRLVTIVGVVEQALERVESQRVERAHQHRSERLATLTADLASALRVDDVLAAVRDGAGDVFGASLVELGDPESVVGVRAAGRSRRPPRMRVVDAAAGRGGLAELPVVVAPDRQVVVSIELPAGRSFEPAEQQLLRVVSQVLGESVARAHAYEQEEARRTVAERLQRAARALGGIEPGELHPHLGARASEVAGADTWSVFVVEDDRMVAVAGQGVEALAVDGQDPVIVLQSAAPLVDAALRGEVIILGADSELLLRYPDLRARHEEAGFATTVVMPVRGADRDTTVVVALSFRDATSLGDAVLAALPEMAKQWSAVLERSDLQRRQQNARARLAVLQALTALLSSARTIGDVVALIERDVPAAFGVLHATLSVLEGDAVVPWASTLEHPASIDLETSAARPTAEAVRTGRPVYVESRDELADRFPDAAADAGVLGTASCVVVPLHWEDRVVGAFGVSYADERVFTPSDREAFETFGALLAHALERIRLADYEHEVAVAMQHAMLGSPDPCAAVDVGAAYLPAEERLEIGGDWFDVIDLGDERVALVVGDVVGHNVAAAAAMGQLRSSVRALASVIADPAELLVRLEGLVEGLDAARSSTVVYAVLEPELGRLRYSCAGHPPPLVVGSDGEVNFLEDGRGFPLGALPGASRSTGEAVLAPGSALVLYSDGLVERRGESLDVGLERLAKTASALCVLPAAALCDRLVSEMVDSPQRDDVAVLTVRPIGSLHLAIPADAARLAVVRRDLRAWLAERGVDGETVEDLTVAAGEALSNAIEHAYLDRNPGTVELDGAVRDGMIHLRVRDGGHWRVDPAPGDRGRGLSLMRRFCTSVEVTTGDDGTTVDLLTPMNGERAP